MAESRGESVAIPRDAPLHIAVWHWTEHFHRVSDRSQVLVDPRQRERVDQAWHIESAARHLNVIGVSLGLQRSTAEDARLRMRSDRQEATMETPRSGIFPRGLPGLVV